MEQLHQLLITYTPITLSEMDGVRLMDRTDTKFVFEFSRLASILEEVKNDYHVLDVNGNRISRYESLYFDTPGFDLYHHHHRGKLNRYKIRFRKYVESELHFFEVKFKNNKGRTIKNRIKQTHIDGQISDKAAHLLKEKTSMLANHLEAKFWVNYSRITLVNKHLPERVTIDIDLHFKNETNSKTIRNLVIAEVKQDKAITSLFVKTMKKQQIREGSISKYCFGVISLFHAIKHNNFKLKFLHLNKLAYATIGSH